MCPFTRNPFWAHMFDPQPNGKGGDMGREERKVRGSGTMGRVGFEGKPKGPPKTTFCVLAFSKAPPF